jgi:fructokinase
VILGTGVGAGLIWRGEVIDGPNAIAGEWGHNPLPWPRDDERPGTACFCGRSGCIETFLSGTGLQKHFKTQTGLDWKTAEIVAQAAAGDAVANAFLLRCDDQLARALAHIINVFDPEVIVLGGGVSNIERWYTTVPKLWGKYVLSDEVNTVLRPAVHGDSSGVRGAAWLWNN